MKSLLLGGTGFIGSVLGAELLKSGSEVASVSLSGRGNAPGIVSVALDLYRHALPRKLISDQDTVFILLGQFHQDFDPVQERALIESLAKTLRPTSARVIYFSSVMVYGHTKIPARETSPCHPVGDYAKHKLEAEGLVIEAIPADRLTVVRPSNVYGTPKNRGFIGNVMKQLLKSEPQIALNGDGMQTRDYIFIDDLVKAVIGVNTMEIPGIINIATGVSHTLIDVVKIAEAVSGKKIACTITHSPVNEPHDNLVSNRLLKSEAHFKHFTSLHNGLNQTLKRYQA